MRQLIRGSLVIALYVPGIAAVAQNTNSGNIRGVVTDATGAVIPGATVKVDDVDKGHFSHLHNRWSRSLRYWLNRSGSLSDHRYGARLPDLCPWPDYIARRDRRLSTRS